MGDTRKRSVVKTCIFRIFTTAVTFTILSFHLNVGDLLYACILNTAGIAIYFLYERVWNRIEWGRSNNDTHSEANSD